MSNVKQETFNEIVELITTHCKDPASREALAQGALFGSPVLDSIDYTGNARNFAVHFVTTLIRFGDWKEGQPAIVAVLIKLHTQVGFKQQEKIERLIAIVTGQEPDKPPESPPVRKIHDCIVRVTRAANQYHLSVRFPNIGLIEHTVTDIPTDNNISTLIKSNTELVNAYQKTLQAVKSDGSLLRIILQIDTTQPQNYLAIDWFQMQCNNVALLEDGHVLLQIHNSGEPSLAFKPIHKARPLRILLTTSNSDAAMVEQCQQDEQLLTKIQTTYAIELQIERRITSNRLLNVFKDVSRNAKPFDIWHHSGHLLYADDEVSLIFNTAGNNKFTFKQLQKVFTLYPAVTLGMLTMPDAANPVTMQYRPFALPLASILMLPSDRLARSTFTETFYEHVLSNSLDVAVRDGLDAMVAQRCDTFPLYLTHTLDTRN